MIPINAMSLSIENTVEPSEAEIAAVLRAKGISEFIDLIARNEYNQNDFFAGFTNNEFTENEIIRICKALETNTKITCFTFGASAEAHKKHLPIICEHLKINKTITSVNLSKIDLGTEGLKEIVRLLKTNQNITSLILKKANIHEDQSVALLAHLIVTNKSLLHLDLSGNNFSEQNLNRIIDALSKNSSLQTLNLINIKSMNSALAKRLADVNSKIKLNQARDRHINEDAGKDKAALLLELSKPEILTRPKAALENPLELENKQELERKQQLEHSSSSGSEFGSSEDGVAVPVKRSRHFKDYLDVSDLLDNQKLIKAVRNKQCNQNNFNAAFSKLHFQGAELKSLFEALNTNPEIHTLKLGSMSEGRYGFGTICELLNTNTTIKNFDLFMFCIGEEGLETLLKLFKTNTTIVALNIFWAGFYTKKAACLVRDLILTNKNLRSLNIGHMMFNEPEFMMIFQALTMNNTLLEISFDSTHMLRKTGPNKKSLMMELMAVIKNHPSITALDINHNQFSVEEITAVTTVLRDNPRIKSLNLSWIGDDYTVGNKALPPQGYTILSEALAKSKTLEHLAMNCMMFDEQTHKQVLDALMLNTSIRRLEFNNYVEKQTLTNFIDFLKQQPYIEHITLPMIFSVKDMFDHLDEAFKVNNRIKEVRFSSAGSESAWYERLLKFLKDHPHVTSAIVYYYQDDPELRKQFQKRVEIQLDENRKPERNAVRRSFLEGFYRSEAYMRNLEPVSAPAATAGSVSKAVNLLPRFRAFDKNILNNIFSFLDLDQATRYAPLPRVPVTRTETLEKPAKGKEKGRRFRI